MKIKHIVSAIIVFLVLVGCGKKESTKSVSSMDTSKSQTTPIVDAKNIQTNVALEVNENKIINMVGKIVSVEDTGLGPFYGVTIEKQNSSEIVYFMVDIGDVVNYRNQYTDNTLVGKTVAIQYKQQIDTSITEMMLKEELLKLKSQAHVCLSGKFLDGEEGDMGSYITLIDPDGNQKIYKGDFNLFTDNIEKYKGKDVILYYQDEIENKLVSLKAVK